MRELLDELYVSYNRLLADLRIGYPISIDRLKPLWALINKLYFIRFEDYLDPEVLKILEYYEYLR